MILYRNGTPIRDLDAIKECLRCADGQWVDVTANIDWQATRKTAMGEWGTGKPDFDKIARLFPHYQGFETRDSHDNRGGWVIEVRHTPAVVEDESDDLPNEGEPEEVYTITAKGLLWLHLIRLCETGPVRASDVLSELTPIEQSELLQVFVTETMRAMLRDGELASAEVTFEDVPLVIPETS